jgi:hypothetical protein
MSTDRTIAHARDYPYDDNKKQMKDPAVLSARAVITNLCDRSGIGNALEEVEDNETRIEIIQSLAQIIRKCYKS